MNIMKINSIIGSCTVSLRRRCGYTIRLDRGMPPSVASEVPNARSKFEHPYGETGQLNNTSLGEPGVALPYLRASRGAAVKYHNHFHIFETNPEVPAPELFCAGNFFF
jgi:hypothetical protein